MDVILRSREDLARGGDHEPLREVATDGSRHVVAFLAEPSETPVDEVLKGSTLARTGTWWTASRCTSGAPTACGTARR
ncbi:hypothetical protein KIF24_29430 [Micromonospora sp. Llam7]|uniref:hypothetical protein n=1 Tax=Micromonospora tarapacensis TaxID=2835305 RepID=UPI001C83BA62|nr:hypothetical protein [Micromonospora tarapacensis]